MNDVGINTVLSKAESIYDKLVSIRRELHKIPEPSLKEFRTSELIAGVLKSADIPFDRGIAGTGIAAYLSNNRSKTIALRADMDALPVKEETGLEFSSENDGYSHVCGHDMHMTCLLGALLLLNDVKNSLKVDIKAIFQPAEEIVRGGAGRMISEGILKNPDVDSIFGLHVDPYFPTGTIALRSGPMMASARAFTIRVIGKGGHAAKPYSSIDPIFIASNIIIALQSISNKMIDSLDPGLLTITQINAGQTYNIIPSEAVFKGSIRALNENADEVIPKKVLQIATGIAETYGAKVEIEFERGNEVLSNDPDLSDYIISTGKRLLGEKNVQNYKGTFGGEDFADYLKYVKGCYFRLGCVNESEIGNVSLHNPGFNPDERSLIYGTGMLTALALDYNNEK